MKATLLRVYGPQYIQSIQMKSSQFLKIQNYYSIKMRKIPVIIARAHVLIF